MQKNYEVLLGEILSPSFFSPFHFVVELVLLITCNLFGFQQLVFVCAVSQFTLYGVLKGNKPDFHVAMPPDAAKPFYASLVEKIQKAYRVDAVKGDQLLHVHMYNYMCLLMCV